ncbi:nucleotide exchange factor GrpE [Paenibacillus sp. GP183]|uniref:nucleotide exchange factor GrpE n=1 Tax=Paenibacillus sp. GP183 TaxID=1882751 RepID=UPI0008983821|nr:nucleotide exchange factor GrpE [Paenibacillus sp. GP183]SEB40728.1 molecular chaperone GrpE [Paenibacillus sp. GP183]
MNTGNNKSEGTYTAAEEKNDQQDVPIQSEEQFEEAVIIDEQAEPIQSEEQFEEAAADTQLEELRKQAEENQQRYLRVQADFDNFRRRSRLEKEEFAKYASLKLIEQLLPVVDNFERALSSSKDTKDFEALVKGLDMTFRQLDQLLAQEGLTPIEAVGQPFNPEFHQAIMQVESEEHEEGIVVEEIQKGYLLKDKVVRPAMVKVSV